jgi:hypothetical protein
MARVQYQVLGTPSQRSRLAFRISWPLVGLFSSTMSSRVRQLGRNVSKRKRAVMYDDSIPYTPT